MTTIDSTPNTLCIVYTLGSRQDIDSLGRPKRGWGTPAQRPTASTPSFSSTPVAAAAPTTQAATYNTAAAFEKEWRRRRRQQHDGRYEACVALLRAAGGAGFIRARLSKGELGPDLLGEMVEALGAAVAPSTSTTDGEADVPWARACVVALGATPRFGLHCALLSAGQRVAGRALVEAVAAGLRPAADSEETGEARALARVREALV